MELSYKNIVLIALVLVLLLGAGLLLILIYRNGGERLDADPEGVASSGVLSAKAASLKLTENPWPIFRGDRSLNGVAKGWLADSLSLYWTFQASGAINSSAVVSGGQVFFGCDESKVYALDVKTGRERWTYSSRDAVEAPPCVVESSVYVGSLDSFLYCLDVRTGRLKWKYETDGEIHGSANWYRTAQGNLRILIGSYDYNLHCVDGATGQKVWAYESDNYINGCPSLGFGPEIIGDPCTEAASPASLRIYFGGCDAQLHVVSAQTGERLHLYDCEAYIAGSAVLSGVWAFLGNYEDAFLCLNINTGQRRWTHKNEGYPFYSSPAMDGRDVVVGCRDKQLYCFDRNDGAIRWTFAARDEIDSSPVICGDKVVFGASDGWLYLVERGQGKKVWAYEIGQPLISSPAVADGMVFIGGQDGNLYAFGP